MFELEKLNYEFGEFGVDLSFESFKFHYNGHHKTYVDNLNKILLDKPEFAGKSLEEIIKETYNDASKIGVFNNAAQIWNHNFFWKSITPQKARINKQLLEILQQSFKSFESFKEDFCSIGAKIFGSGWIWLVFNEQTNLIEILTTTNAFNPLPSAHLRPLLVIDVWEHAYYIDYRNKRPLYLKTIFDYLNWDFAFENYSAK